MGWGGGGGGGRNRARRGRAERDVSLEWAEEPVLSEREEGEEGGGGSGGSGGGVGGGCDAFTEEVLSGWRSPPLPRLSAQTQTAPLSGPCQLSGLSSAPG